MPGQITPLPRNLHRPVNLPEGIPRRNNQGTVRGIESHFKPAIANNPSPVVIPQLQGGRSFEVRAQSLSILPKYHGQAHEEPYLHIVAYDARCNTIDGQGFSTDDVKLVLFQFTLEDKAQQWFHSLPSPSIFTWNEMQQLFLDEFYTPMRTNNARKDIRGFRQQPGELFHEAFNRFKMMLKNCPHHGIYLWELLNAFHEGLTDEDAKDVSSISNGTSGTNYEEDNWEFLERTARISKRKAQSSRSARHSVVRAVENPPDASGKFPMCGHCGDIGHIANQCPVIHGEGEDLNPGFQGNNQSGGQRNYNQNRFQGNFQSGYQSNQSGPIGPSNTSGSNDVVEMLKAIQLDLQNHTQKDEVRDKAIQALTTQMGQLATEMKELKQSSGKLPSDTTTNPTHQKKGSSVGQVSTLRNGKSYKKVDTPPQLVDGVVEDLGKDGENDDDSEPNIVKINGKNTCATTSEPIKAKEGESILPFPEALKDPGNTKIINKRGPQPEEI
ncbi:uncharacterized protein LOC110887797 [Helianthus annuus]|uniref:uncharacterized protein LOC110887797 n=1 Tax=Helianthus annuus TaxID=4232 RepID=UPI000B8F7533|nr:uncharacterized protein LOC110887797 [Helianthus annuus]